LNGRPRHRGSRVCAGGRIRAGGWSCARGRFGAGDGGSGGGRAALLRQDAREFAAQCIGTDRHDRLFGLGRLSHFTNHVDGLQQHLHGIRRNRTHAVAHFVEQSLDRVRELRDLEEAEGSRPAFDRVSGAEDRIDGFAVRMRIEREQARFHRIQTFKAFLEENLDDLFHF